MEYQVFLNILCFLRCVPILLHLLKYLGLKSAKLFDHAPINDPNLESLVFVTKSVQALFQPLEYHRQP